MFWRGPYLHVHISLSSARYIGGSKFYKFRGVHIFRQISSGGNQFWGVHFCCDRTRSAIALEEGGGGGGGGGGGEGAVQLTRCEH